MPTEPPDLATAVARHRSGDLAGAETLYRRLLGDHPGNPDALHLLGLVRHDRGDPAEARALIREAVARTPDFDIAQRNLANVARATGDLPLARASGRRATVLDPTSPTSLFGLAGTARQQGEPAAALRLLRRTLRLDPGLVGAWQDRAVAAMAQGDTAAAERDTRRAVMLRPDRADLARNLGWVVLQRADWVDARILLLRGRAIAPRNSGIATALATANTHLGRHDETLAILESVLDDHPGIADIWATLGRCRLTTGPLDTANLAWRRALLLDPAHPTAWMGLSATTILEAAGSGKDEPRPARWSHRAGIVAPTTLIPASGRPRGTLLVLKALQGGCFWMADEHGFRTSTGNNFVDYVGTADLARIVLYVDYCDRLPDHLPPATAVCSTIADPDASPLALERAAALVARLGLPAINRPERVAATRRDLLADSVGPVPGLVFPRVVRVDAADRRVAPLATVAARHELALPVLARQAGTHTGESLELCRTQAELDRFDSANPDVPVVLARFVDYADRNGVYRKMRVFWIDGALYPVHWFAAPRWYVRGHEDARRLMRERPELTAEMRRFLAAPEAAVGGTAWQALGTIGSRLGLEFVGIDFTVLESGEVLVFEANPAMTHHFEFVKEMPFQQPALEAISAAFDRMVHDRATAGPSAIRRSSSAVRASR